VHLAFSFDSPDTHAANVETIVLSARKSLDICDDPAALLLGATLDLIVVAVLMGDKDYICG